ncbi:hypothetical protein N7528_008612 [Penicillium herquei]|nr:hypothetical protein N7528_008612 [Penicillium herquei]
MSNQGAYSSRPSAWVPLQSVSEDNYLPSYADHRNDQFELDEESFPTMKYSRISDPSLPLWQDSSADSDTRRSRSRTRRIRVCRVLKRPFWILFAIFGLAAFTTLSLDIILSFFAETRDRHIFPGHPPSSFSSWTTHGVNPVPCHSHNDYWRRIPLYSALSAGCTSVEADIWPEEEELRVGHSRRTILEGQTLRSLYLDPLFKMLDRHNPLPANASDVSEPGKMAYDEIVGIFANDPAQTLVLLIDFKSEPEKSWSLLMEQLEPLRQRGFLSHFKGRHFFNRPITVVATGDAPFHLLVENSTMRDVFYDAPLDKLSHSPDPESYGEASDNNQVQAQEDGFVYNAENSYYASVDFHRTIGPLTLGSFSEDQLIRLRSQIHAAHSRGLKVRYWGTPKWPVGLRNYVWRVLISEDVDVLNVDDLYGATRQDWRLKWWR